MTLRQWIRGLLGLLVVLTLALNGVAWGQVTNAPLPQVALCADSDRFGVWHIHGDMEDYDVGQLHAGWYTSWTVIKDPPQPAGMRAVQLVRIAQGEPPDGLDAACFDEKWSYACPTWDEIRAVAQRNPGSLWLIGNEPDRQDYVEADRYAELYHDFYTFLKAEDPTCQVAIGGVVQPTPIRLQYLDLILDAYQAQFGGPMPVDVWNVHNYVLREGVTGWGCGIPPGTDSTLAIEYDIQDHDRLDYWTGNMTSMRQWMRDRGYRDRPLIVSEFGILMPEPFGYDHPRVRDFMLRTFDWMMAATDPDTGYPADGNRLVQAWAWYNLSAPTLEGYPTLNHLFDPETGSITALGLAFGAYTTPLTTPLPGTIDLQPIAIHHTRPEPAGSSLVTTTVMADIYNGGAEAAENVVVRFERNGALTEEITIPRIASGQVQLASTQWPNLVLGQLYQVTVTVYPAAQIVECDPFNNRLSVSLLVAEHWIFLPVIQKNR